MRTVIKTLLFALLALLLLANGAWQGWHSIDFALRAVPMEARVQQKYVDALTHQSDGKSRGADFFVRLHFTLEGAAHDVTWQVSVEEYADLRVGDRVAMLADPENPNDVARSATDFAVKSLIYLALALILGLLAALTWFGNPRRADIPG